MKTSLPFLLVALALILAAGCKPKDNSPLVMATTPVFPPFTFKLDGKIVGHEIDLAEKIAEKMGRPLEIRETAFSNLFGEVASGRAHMSLSTITITEERAKLVDFSRPYYKTGTVITSLEEKPLRSPEEARGKLLGIQAGTLAGNICRDVIGTEYVEYPDLTSLAFAIYGGKIDGAVNDAPMARIMTVGETELAVTSPFLSEDKYGVAVNRGERGLLKAVNSVIQETEKDGSLQKSLDKWFRISDESRDHGKFFK